MNTDQDPQPFVRENKCYEQTKAEKYGDVEASGVADPGCLSRIPDLNFSISDPRSRVKKIPGPGSASASMNLSFLSQKIVSKLYEI
jgi:hypothetical protein